LSGVAWGLHYLAATAAFTLRRHVRKLCRHLFSEKQLSANLRSHQETVVNGCFANAMKPGKL